MLEVDHMVWFQEFLMYTATQNTELLGYSIHLYIYLNTNRSRAIKVVAQTQDRDHSKPLPYVQVYALQHHHVTPTREYDMISFSIQQKCRERSPYRL